jgi:hypothetical protein
MSMKAGSYNVEAAKHSQRRPLAHLAFLSLAVFLVLSVIGGLAHRHSETTKQVYRNVVNKIVGRLSFNATKAHLEPRQSAKVVNTEMSDSDLVAAFGCHRAFPAYEAPSRDDFTFRAHTPKEAKILVLQICTNPNTFVEFPLRTHEDFATRHGYSYLTRRRPFVHEDYSAEIRNLDSYWVRAETCFVLLTIVQDKVKILKEVVDAEMAKPAHDRLEWLFFADSDTIVLNQEIKLEDILPPKANASHIHMVLGRDSWGVNAGVFFLSISYVRSRTATDGG